MALRLKCIKDCIIYDETDNYYMNVCNGQEFFVESIKPDKRGIDEYGFYTDFVMILSPEGNLITMPTSTMCHCFKRIGFTG